MDATIAAIDRQPRVATEPRGNQTQSRRSFLAMRNTAFERIHADINDNQVMLYMKGTTMFPQCGFSARVVRILTHLGVSFRTSNVMEDMELRESIKRFANWPTVPQLYVKGEFVGGCDIITEMFQSGELEALLTEKGIPHEAALPESERV
jgi:monothiol glutaredoxin